MLQDRASDAIHEVTNFERRADVRDRYEFATPLEAAVRRHVQYAVGDFSNLLASTDREQSPDGNLTRFQALIELGRLDEALRAMPMPTNPHQRAIYCLTMSIAAELPSEGMKSHYALKPNTPSFVDERRTTLSLQASAFLPESPSFGGDESDRVNPPHWRELAAKYFSEGDDDDVLAAKLMRQIDPPGSEEIAAVEFQPEEKALFLTALSYAYPHKWKDYARAASRLNVEPVFPYHLLRRANGRPN